MANSEARTVVSFAASHAVPVLAVTDPSLLRCSSRNNTHHPSLDKEDSDLDCLRFISSFKEELREIILARGFGFWFVCLTSRDVSTFIQELRLFWGFRSCSHIPVGWCLLSRCQLSWVQKTGVANVVDRSGCYPRQMTGKGKISIPSLEQQFSHWWRMLVWTSHWAGEVVLSRLSSSRILNRSFPKVLLK